ncbi:MAG: hypothetical protein ACE5GW_08735, partial [Planctomycetota bacterium]
MPDRIPGIPSATSFGVVGEGGGGSPGGLSPAEAYPATVLRILGSEGGQIRHEILLLGRHLVLSGEERFAPGTLLDVVPVKEEGGTRLEVRGAKPPAPVRARAPQEEPPGGARAGRARLEALRREGVRDIVRDRGRPPGAGPGPGAPGPPRPVIRLLQRQGILDRHGVRAALRLIEAEAPLHPALLRGGALAEASAGHADPAPAVQRILARLPSLLSEGPVLQGIREGLTTGAALPPASTEGAAAAAARLLPINPPLILDAIGRLVAELLRGDPTLSALDATLGDLAEALSGGEKERALEARLGALLRGGGETEEEGRDGPRGYGDLGARARREASGLLREMERQHVDRHPLLTEVRPLLREAMERTEAAAYLLALEGQAQQREESALPLAVWISDSAERLPFRIRVRDERRGGGEGDEVGFRIEVDTPLLGRVRVEGRLEGEHQGGRLELELAAAEVETLKEIEKGLAPLIERIDGKGYRTRARALRLPSREGEGRASDRPAAGSAAAEAGATADEGESPGG